MRNLRQNVRNLRGLRFSPGSPWQNGALEAFTEMSSPNLSLRTLGDATAGPAPGLFAASPVLQHPPRYPSFCPCAGTVLGFTEAQRTKKLTQSQYVRKVRHAAPLLDRLPGREMTIIRLSVKFLLYSQTEKRPQVSLPSSMVPSLSFPSASRELLVILERCVHKDMI